MIHKILSYNSANSFYFAKGTFIALCTSTKGLIVKVWAGAAVETRTRVTRIRFALQSLISVAAFANRFVIDNDTFALVQTGIRHARTLTAEGALVTAHAFALGEAVFAHFANAAVETHVGGARIFLHSTFLFAKLAPVRIATFANGDIGERVWGTDALVLTRVRLTRITLRLTRNIHSSVTVLRFKKL